jgi:hypothetical protein
MSDNVPEIFPPISMSSKSISKHKSPNSKNKVAPRQSKVSRKSELSHTPSLKDSDARVTKRDENEQTP